MRQAASRKSGCCVHPHMGFEFHLQSGRILWKPSIFVVALTNPQYPASPQQSWPVLRTTRNILPSSDTACMICFTPRFDSCNALHSEKTSQSLQLHFIQVRRLLHLACQITALNLTIKSVTGEKTVHASCSHDTDLTLLCRSEPLLQCQRLCL